MEVGEGGGGSMTRGNGVRDCDEAGKRVKGEGGGKTIEVELLEWTIIHQKVCEGEQVDKMLRKCGELIFCPFYKS